MVRKINHRELENQIKLCYKVKLPLYIHGTMGIGKSQVVRETARKIANDLGKDFLDGKPNGKESFCLIDRRVSQLEPSDLLGLPNFTHNEKEQKVVKWFAPDWLPQDKESSGIIFLDELSNAMPSIQHACYQLVLDRKLGSYELPDNWIVVAGGNLASDNSGVYTLSSAFANRFSHLELTIPSKKDWVEWAFKNDIDNRIIAFIEFNESYLHTYDKSKNNLVFSSPRSWQFLSKLIKGIKNIDDIEISAHSTIGDGIGTEFISFVKLRKQLNIEDLLKNPEKVKEIKEISEKYALLTAISDRIREKPTDLETYEAVMKLVNYLEEEFKIILLRFILKNAQEGLMRDKKVDSKESARTYLIKNIFSKIPEWTKNIQRFTEFLTF